MQPIFLDFGFLQIRWYGLMYAVALLIGIKLILTEIKRRKLGYNEDSLMNVMLGTFAGGIICARIYYIVFNFGTYSSDLWEIFAVWHGGLAIHGGIFGGILCGYLLCRHYRIAPWEFADIAVPAVLLGQALGRIGNLTNGDAHGIPTTLPWGLVFPAGTPAGDEFPGLPLHPVMLYEMILNFLFFLVLFRLQKKGYKNGFIFCLYLIFYSIARFIVSFFRADDFYVFGLNLPQLVSLVLIAVNSYIIWRYQLYRTKEGAR
ncbi:prolipoprotein diacylglyceryl transferase [Candidatus Termititenax dinenymphae]|uniref:Phosphatidylglycerol--prolipoprotein diacylglyceryl transferase n=1 Tax=Candidatus Termititenax dinenymphae TaxID=2218523 RepID=A0A388TKJ2_9BACT|nr:prolipoprotein diacylglyceryl transferase [Candidatus Termititenax dinenymphae]